MIEIYHGDCQKLSSDKIKSESVDLIFTDPPYSKKYLPLYKWLAQEAIRALKPNGFLIAYCGPYWKDRVMNYLNAELQYFYDFILRHNGNTSILWNRKIISGYKSLLCFHRKDSKPKPKTNILGFINGTGGDKRFHKWGQDEHTANYFIQCLSNENDLVVDYFLGGGTTAIVCKKNNRRFVGFEIDQEAFQIADLRIRDEKFNNLKQDQLNFLSKLESA